MNAILVWVLVTISDGGYNRGNVSYSPPLATLEDCQRIQGQLPRYQLNSVCVQVKEVLK